MDGPSDLNKDGSYGLTQPRPPNYGHPPGYDTSKLSFKQRAYLDRPRPPYKMMEFAHGDKPRLVWLNSPKGTYEWNNGSVINYLVPGGNTEFLITTNQFYNLLKANCQGIYADTTNAELEKLADTLITKDNRLENYKLQILIILKDFRNNFKELDNTMAEIDSMKFQTLEKKPIDDSDRETIDHISNNLIYTIAARNMTRVTRNEPLWIWPRPITPTLLTFLGLNKRL